MPVIALVAAGARLGLSLGKTFGAHGFDVALIARSPQRLGELTARLEAAGIKAAGSKHTMDFSTRSQLASGH